MHSLACMCVCVCVCVCACVCDMLVDYRNGSWCDVEYNTDVM